jgi:peptidoglycan L-alanyl-D-glutamate endopeptidase CwlK
MSDKLTIDKIKKFHPNYRAKLEAEYLEINSQLPIGVRLRFTSVLRTNKEQDDLFDQGRTKGGPIVTNNKGGQSIHNYGGAFDIVILLDEDNNGSFEKAVWNGAHFNKVVNFFKEKGYEWGGNWKFKDAPHFQLKKKNGSSLKWQELKLLIIGGKCINENGIAYPNV